MGYIHAIYADLQAIHEGQTLIAERRPEVEAEAAIYRLLENRP